MHVRRAPGLALLLLILLLSSLGSALPMKPDLGKILQDEINRPASYPPARVAWNGPEGAARPPFNPVYESMRYPLSAEAMQEKLLAVAAPRPGMVLSFLALVLLVRMMRREQSRRMTPVITMPTPLVPAEEAA